MVNPDVLILRAALEKLVGAETEDLIAAAMVFPAAKRKNLMAVLGLLAEENRGWVNAELESADA